MIGSCVVYGSKELDENSSLTFVLNNLNEILELLIEAGK